MALMDAYTELRHFSDWSRYDPTFKADSSAMCSARGCVKAGIWHVLYSCIYIFTDAIRTEQGLTLTSASSV